MTTISGRVWWRDLKQKNAFFTQINNIDVKGADVNSIKIELKNKKPKPRDILGKEDLIALSNRVSRIKGLTIEQLIYCRIANLKIYNKN